MCSPREADPIALQYSAKGYNTFVLYYTVGENAVFPKPLIDLSKAMKIVRENAKEWGVIPEKLRFAAFRQAVTLPHHSVYIGTCPR